MSKSDFKCEETNKDVILTNFSKDNWKCKKISFNEGHASFGEIYRVINNEEKKSYIIKKIKIVDDNTVEDDDTTEKEFLNEIKILKRLNDLTPKIKKCWIYTDNNNQKFGYIALENYCWNKKRGKLYRECGTYEKYLYEVLDEDGLLNNGDITTTDLKEKLKRERKRVNIDDINKYKDKIEELKEENNTIDDSTKLRENRDEIERLYKELNKINENKKTLKMLSRFRKKRRRATFLIFDKINKIHEKGVYINDIRLPNIMYKYSSKNGYDFTLIDFGLSKIFKREDKSNNLINRLNDYLKCIYEMYYDSPNLIDIEDRTVKLKRFKNREPEIYDELKEIYKKYKENHSNKIKNDFNYYINLANEKLKKKEYS